MENASKALLISGGILLTILTLSLIIYLSNNIQLIGKAEKDKITQKQLVEFNKQYEAYNRNLLYGTDVLTVVNKAKENNKKYNITTEPTNLYYIRSNCKGFKWK